MSQRHYPLRLEKDDVTLERARPQLCSCTARATHWIRVDFRALGQSAVIDRVCERCGHVAVQRMRAALPAARER